MTVRCLSRVVIKANSTAVLRIRFYQQTGPGGNYATPLATHYVAWCKLCAVYGHAMPKTNMDVRTGLKTS